MARKKVEQVKVSYDANSTARNVVTTMLQNSGKSDTKPGYPSDKRYLQSVDTFGKETGFVTMGQLRLLGMMYNRIMGNGTPLSWE